MVFSCERFEKAGTLDIVVALAVVGFILVFGIVSRWLFPCPECDDSGESPEPFWGTHPRTLLGV